MKKTLKLFTVGMLATVALSSCKKNRICQCVYTDGDTSDYVIVNESKKGAKNICTAKSHESRNCELK